VPVISVSSTKGGVGKTTLVICLAEAVAQQGGSVAVLDADPNGHVSTWYDVAKEETDTKVKVIPGVTEANIHDHIDAVVDDYSIVLIDLEGAASQIVTFAIARSDLVLIPTRSSAMDLQEVFRTHDQVRHAERMLKRPIKARAVFCQVPGLVNKVQSHAVSEVERRGVPCLNAQVLMRPAAYAQIHFTGVTPAHPEGDPKARREIHSVLEEILTIFREDA